MQKLNLAGCGLLLLLWSVSAQSALERIGDFALIDGDGVFHQLSRYQHRKVVVMTGVRAGVNASGKRMRIAVAYPVGSTVQVIGALDNSISNPTNPDPAKAVEFGLNSWDEMFTGYLTYYRE